MPAYVFKGHLEKTLLLTSKRPRFQLKTEQMFVHGLTQCHKYLSIWYVLVQILLRI